MGFVNSERFEHVHIDIVGPLSQSRQGNMYIFTMIDRESRCLETTRMSNISAENCARVFLRDWICRFGVPKRVTSDQGQQFEGHLFSRLMKVLNISKIRTTPYHPQGN